MIVVIYEAQVQQAAFPGCRFVQNDGCILIIGAPDKLPAGVTPGSHPGVELAEGEIVVGVFSNQVVKSIQVAADPEQQNVSPIVSPGGRRMRPS